METVYGFTPRLNAVLLHNANKYPYFPIYFLRTLNKKYEYLKLLLKIIK